MGLRPKPPGRLRRKNVAGGSAPRSRAASRKNESGAPPQTPGAFAKLRAPPQTPSCTGFGAEPQRGLGRSSSGGLLAPASFLRRSRPGVWGPSPLEHCELSCFAIGGQNCFTHIIHPSTNSTSLITSRPYAAFRIQCGVHRQIFPLFGLPRPVHSVILNGMVPGHKGAILAHLQQIRVPGIHRVYGLHILLSTSSTLPGAREARPFSGARPPRPRVKGMVLSQWTVGTIQR